MTTLPHEPLPVVDERCRLLHRREWRERTALMNELFAYCGLVCSTCPIYEATREGNKEIQLRKRADIARLCREQYGMNYEAADITDCDGCTTEAGRIFSGCIQCTIRACAKKREVNTCAHCPDYFCQQLEEFFANDPEAKVRLDGIRKKIS